MAASNTPTTSARRAQASHSMRALLSASKGYTKRHPKTTLFQAAMAVMAVGSGGLLAPIMSTIGFSSIGPVAGTLAAWYQSVYGATGIFSFCQSAAMGGYAVLALNAIVRGAGVVGAVVAGFFKGEPRATTVEDVVDEEEV